MSFQGVARAIVPKAGLPGLTFCEDMARPRRAAVRLSSLTFWPNLSLPRPPIWPSPS